MTRASVVLAGVLAACALVTCRKRARVFPVDRRRRFERFHQYTVDADRSTAGWPRPSRLKGL